MIDVKGLAKRFRLPKRGAAPASARDVREHDGWLHAVRDVSFSCAPGEVQNLIEDAIDKSVRIIPLACEGKLDIATMQLHTA